MSRAGKGKRRAEAKAAKMRRKAEQHRPGGQSKYAIKSKRAAAGWNNPRSPIKWAGEPI